MREQYRPILKIEKNGESHVYAFVTRSISRCEEKKTLLTSFLFLLARVLVKNHAKPKAKSEKEKRQKRNGKQEKQAVSFVF